MAIWQGKSRRKPSGGRRRANRGKRRFEIGSELQETRIGPEKKKISRIRADHRRYRAISTTSVNVIDIRTRKAKRAKIISVLENPANPNYVRRNLLTKGAVIETDLGIATITSRPRQDGIINAILTRPKRE